MLPYTAREAYQEESFQDRLTRLAVSTDLKFAKKGKQAPSPAVEGEVATALLD